MKYDYLIKMFWDSKQVELLICTNWLWSRWAFGSRPYTNLIIFVWVAFGVFFKFCVKLVYTNVKPYSKWNWMSDSYELCRNTLKKLTFSGIELTMSGFENQRSSPLCQTIVFLTQIYTAQVDVQPTKTHLYYKIIIKILR